MLGNNFNAGYSITGGVRDSLNNVGVSVAPDTFTNSGQWLVQVVHRGGIDQDFSIVITGDASIVSRPDLLAFPESIFLSSESPLQNDIISIRASWMNQGTADAGAFDWKLEDLTEGSTLIQVSPKGSHQVELRRKSLRIHLPQLVFIPKTHLGCK